MFSITIDFGGGVYLSSSAGDDDGAAGVDFLLSDTTFWHRVNISLKKSCNFSTKVCVAQVCGLFCNVKPSVGHILVNKHDVMRLRHTF